MKIGIIIYSMTGNTRAVAQRLLDTMKTKGLDASLLEIRTISDDPDHLAVELLERPETTGFDKLVFASPVHAFSLSRVMKTYLSETEDLAGKESVLFVTHHFPFAWMGGNSALRQMKNRVQKKHGSVKQLFCVNWSSKKREDNIRQLLDQAFS
jgi:menaquinone-dependent protoporphyrinogen IX oxidase